VSELAITHDGLELVSAVPSGGTAPISVAVRGSLVYVLNSGNGVNIAGFVAGAGGLTPPGSS
jgi:6-phosphogluconolactonase